jgi:hypothetical protein
MYALLLILGGGRLFAQPVGPPTPEEQRDLELVSLARARTELFTRVGALPIRQGVALADWLAGDVDLDRAVRRWVRQRPRFGSARHYSDAVCEVDVRVDPGELRDFLVKLMADYPEAASSRGIDAEALKAAASGWPVVWATGRVAQSRNLRSGQPAGWEDVSREGIELARSAATASAYQALLEKASQLKVTHARRLHEFLDSSKEVRAAVQVELQRAAKAKVEFAPDQVAVAEARVEMRDLLRILTRAHQEHYRGTEFEAADFREMALLARQEELTATGLGTPPSHTFLQARYEPIEFNVPTWVDTMLTAVGRYEHDPADGPADEEAGREAARLDGLARLYRQIEQLVIQKDVTVAGFLGYHQELKDDVALFLSGTRAVSRPVVGPDGGVEVKVELPLRRLWEIIRRKMKLEEVEPPESPKDGPPSSGPAPHS